MSRAVRANQPIEILLVEDNPADVRLTMEALKTWTRESRVQVVSDGDEALRYLRRQGTFSEASRPDLLLLDLNLPRMDGRELLAEIKSDADLKRIPVVVLTTSNAEQDILKTYDLHANCYVIKPVDLEDFIGAIHSIETFWGTIVTLPPHAGHAPADT